MITVTHEEIRDKMFFIRGEDNDSFPVAVIKVSDLLNLAKPQGEWILNKDGNPECPFCHHSFTYFGNFCGNCGVEMGGK